jgi:hypothetical protein
VGALFKKKQRKIPQRNGGKFDISGTVQATERSLTFLKTREQAGVNDIVPHHLGAGVNELRTFLDWSCRKKFSPYQEILWFGCSE